MFDAKKLEYVFTDQGSVPVDKFAEENGFVWTESPIGTQAAKDYIKKNKSSIEQQQSRELLSQAVVNEGHQPNPDFSVDDMLAVLGITKEKFLQSVTEREKLCDTFLTSTNKYANLVV